MMQRVLIEFVVEVPNAAVAGDVETRVATEHYARLCEMFRSVTGYEPIQAPKHPGIMIVSEPVTWSAKEQDWIGPDDENDDDDDE